MSSDDFFRNRLEQMIDLRHPLAVLSKRMPWEQWVHQSDESGGVSEVVGCGFMRARRFVLL